MNKKIFRTIISFIFIFSFVGCSCKENKEEVKQGSIEAPYTVAYFDKDINGRYTIVSPFGTRSSIVYFYASDKEKIEQYYIDEYTRLHQLFDRHYYYFNESNELVNNLRILNESNGETINVDEDLIQIFKEGIRFTKLSKGKFNIAVGHLSDLWNGFIDVGDSLKYQDATNLTKYAFEDGTYVKDENGKYIYMYGIFIDISNNTSRHSLVEGKYVESLEGNYIDLTNIAPSEEQIEYAKLCTPNYENIEDYIVIDDENNTITMNSYNGCKTNVTLGALAKSYASERIASNEAIKNGNFLINSGQSTIKIIGENLSKESGIWLVGITDSYLSYVGVDIASYTLTLTSNSSISTSSGDNESYKCGDNYYHHIIDPVSGYPYQERFAVTAFMDNAMYADIITTTLMTMTMDETIEYLKVLKNDNIHVELIIQEKENNFVKVYLTSGIKDKFDKAKDQEYQEHIDSIVVEDFNYEA